MQQPIRKHNSKSENTQQQNQNTTANLKMKPKTIKKKKKKKSGKAPFSIFLHDAWEGFSLWFHFISFTSNRDVLRICSIIPAPFDDLPACSKERYSHPISWPISTFYIYTHKSWLTWHTLHGFDQSWEYGGHTDCCYLSCLTQRGPLEEDLSPFTSSPTLPLTPDG